MAAHTPRTGWLILDGMSPIQLIDVEVNEITEAVGTKGENARGWPIPDWTGAERHIEIRGRYEKLGQDAAREG